MFIWPFLSKVQSQGIAWLLHNFLPISAWCCLWKESVLGSKTQDFHTEAAIRRCSLKKTPTQTFSYEYCEIFKNCFLYITTLETTSFHSKLFWKKLVLRIHWRLSTILKTRNKSVWSNVFWYVEVCIFWKCIRYTIHWDKIQILKKFPSDKINGTKNALFFFVSSNSSQVYF